MNMPGELRGLQMFIGDIRACHSREEEEKRVNKELTNIRQKFKSGSMNSYQKKKYVSKILFIYLLGYDIDFGHAEAVGLCGSTKFSEKQLGYLAASLLLQSNPDLVRLIINQIKKDLADPNMHFASLALQCIANIGGLELTESVCTDVWKLIHNKGSSEFVKKKAVLTALSLYRLHPEAVPIREWIPDVKDLLKTTDMGIFMSFCSFVDELSNEYRHEFLQSSNIFIDKLADIILEKRCPQDYHYYKTPVPWLQVKLLEVLRKLCPNNPNYNLSKLQSILTEIIRSHKIIQRGQQSNNVANSIFLSAISLISDIMPDSDMLDSAIDVLHGFLVSKETNLRYLGLENLTQLTKIDHCVGRIKKHKELIIELLQDGDISVKKEAVDLLFAICDSGNYDFIVTQLLHHLNVTDEELKNELILKIAILAENFAKDVQWYFTTIFSLIESGGDDVAKEVWFKAIHIAVNNLNLQDFAVRQCVDALQTDDLSDSLLRVCCYIVGEYGHLIADKPGYFPNEQLNLLHKYFEISPNDTRAMLLTSYLKITNLFPQTTSIIQSIFKEHMKDLDVELQQRSCEYYELCLPENKEMLAIVCDEMPEFTLSADNLVRVLKNTQPLEKVITTSIASPEMQPPIAKNHSDLLDLFGDVPVQQTTNYATSTINDLLGDTMSQQKRSKVVDGLLLSNIMTTGEGLLFEDVELQVGLKSQFENAYGAISIYIGNKSTSSFVNLTIDITSIDGLLMTVKESIPLTVQHSSQQKHVVEFQAQSPFTTRPLLTISYTKNNELIELSTILPLHLFRFQSSLQLTEADYLTRAQKLVQPTQIAVLDMNVLVDLKTIEQKLMGLKFSKISSDATCLTSASIINCLTMRIGLLLKVVLVNKVNHTYIDVKDCY